MHIDNLEKVANLKDLRNRLLEAKAYAGEHGFYFYPSIGGCERRELKIETNEDHPFRTALLDFIDERLAQVEHEIADYGVILADAKEADDAL